MNGPEVRIDINAPVLQSTLPPFDTKTGDIECPKAKALVELAVNGIIDWAKLIKKGSP